MAILFDMDQAQWNEWVETRPAIVQDLCRRFPPNRLYRLSSTGHRVTIYSYSEDGTLTVNVTGQYNVVTFERRVFGIAPDYLKECDLPMEGELLGAVLTDREDVERHLEKLRQEYEATGDL